MTEISKSKKKKIDRPLLYAHAIGAVGLGFKSRVGLVGTVSRTARHGCDVISELCSQALSRGDGPRHSLHASAEYREYNEELIFFMTEIKQSRFDRPTGYSPKQGWGTGKAQRATLIAQYFQRATFTFNLLILF